MEATRRGGFERILVGGGGVGLALLGTLGAVVTGVLPWPALPAVWLCGNGALVLLLNARPAATTEGHPAADPAAPTSPALPR